MGAGLVAVPVASASAATPTSLVGSKPGWATPAAEVGAVPATAQVQFRVYLHSPNDAAAEAEAQNLSDPSSASFRQWLTPAQVLAQYDPSAATAAAVSKWLGTTGVTVNDVADNRLYVEATGTVAQIAKAFGVQLNDYRYKGHTLRSPDRDLTVPASIGGLVDGVLGVDESQVLFTPSIITPGQDGAGGAIAPNAQPSGPATVAPPDGFRNATPCSAYYGQKIDTTDPAYPGYGKNLPYAPCGYTPTQLRSAYGMNQAVDRGIDGHGTTVAIVDAFASPTLYEDAREYAKKNDPSHPLRPGQFNEYLFPTTTSLEPPDQCDAEGWYGEQTLDVEAVHAMAPGAHILYVGGSDCEDPSLDKALNKVVAKHLAEIVSNSYGDAGEDVPADEVNAFHAIARNAVLEGIGVYFSSGDDGDEVADLGFASADFSASDPLVTAVGGTSTGIGANGRTTFQTGWETSKSTLSDGTYAPLPPAYLYGSGGGTSVLFKEPWYQKGVVPHSLAVQNQTGTGHATGRVVPDISADGDPNTGMLIGETQTFPDGVYYDQYRIGGTSLASPLFAGVMALADDATGYAHGFINPSLYRLAGSNAVNDVLHVKGADVRQDYVDGTDADDGTVTSIRTFDTQGLAIATTRGYDNTTGLGTPNGLSFLFRI